jgi:hypothetical protein
MVNPFMGPSKHMSFENLRGKLKTFLFDVLTHFLFFAPVLQQDFILVIGGDFLVFLYAEHISQLSGLAREHASFSAVVGPTGTVI